MILGDLKKEIKVLSQVKEKLIQALQKYGLDYSRNFDRNIEEKNRFQNYTISDINSK